MTENANLSVVMCTISMIHYRRAFFSYSLSVQRTSEMKGNIPGITKSIETNVNPKTEQISIDSYVSNYIKRAASVCVSSGCGAGGFSSVFVLFPTEHFLPLVIRPRSTSFPHRTHAYNYKPANACPIFKFRLF